MDKINENSKAYSFYVVSVPQQEEIQLSIEKLKEYQTSLISATVTGKIDVRVESHD